MGAPDAVILVMVSRWSVSWKGHRAGRGDFASLPGGVIEQDVVGMNTPSPLTASHEPTDARDVGRMFDRIAPTYDALNGILSFGQNKLWERKLVRQLPRDLDATYLDLCTGTGALIPKLAVRCARVVGADISPQMLVEGRRRHRKISTCEFVLADAQNLPFAEGSFDAATIAYGIRNVPDRVRALQEVNRVCKPGATLAILEFGQARNRLWSALFGWYSRVVIPSVGAFVSGEREAYDYLRKTSAVFPCGERFEALLREAGWVPMQTESLSGGVAYIYVARKPG